MVRPLVVVAVVAIVAIGGAAHGSGMPRRMGMYPQQGAPLAMLDSDVAVHVHGPIAEVVVTQTFRNDADHATEATYIFPLPLDAAVSAMAIKSGMRTIHAAIARREDAQRRYEEAIRAGVGAGLLDEERPDVFTQTVAAIPAHASVVVTLRFDTVARYRDGTWELVLPLVVAPRYVPGTASGRPTTGAGRAPDTDRSPDASRLTPGGAPGAGGKTAVTLELADAVDDVTSPTHELAKTERGYAFVDPHSDHDAIVRWREHAPSAGWVEQDDDGGYAAVIVTAPAAAARTAALRCLVVLDRSATTRGDADAVEHPLVRALFGALTAKDQAAVTGTDRVDWRSPDQVLRALEDGWPRSPGAFDLTKVLGAIRRDGAAIVLVSDGLVADDRAAIAAARKLGAPIHVVGIGPAPNRGLLAALANATGGTIRFAAGDDDLVALARDVVADAASPPAPLAVTWGTLAASDVVPGTLPRLGAGQSALVVARVKRAQAANARARGDVFALASIAAPHAPEGATSPRGALARRWARMKLDDLLATGDRRAITAHALAYALVSPYTSMVAIGEEVVIDGGVKHSVAVPVSVPAGMHWQLVKSELVVDTGDREQANWKTSPKHESTEKQNGSASDGRADHDEDSTGYDGGRPVMRPPNTAPVPPPPVAASSDAQPVLEQDVAVNRTLAPPRHRYRLALAAGGGLAVEHGNVDGVTALSGRIELGGRWLGGIEGSLWLVGGLHAQGDLLATVTRRGLGRWLELGGGLGFHLGGGSGLAANLTLRTRLPVRHLAAYLRYDAALLRHDAALDGQNAASVGIESRW